MDDLEFELPKDFFTSSNRLAEMYNRYHAGIDPALEPAHNAGALEMFSKLLKSTMNTDKVLYQFESFADTENAKQLQEERENIILGIKSIEQSVQHYEDKIVDMKQQLSIVEEQLDVLRPGSFKTGELKLERTTSRLINKLEHEIMNALRKYPGELSDKVIMMHPDTFRAVMSEISYISHMSSSSDPKKLHYKGIRVIRSFDVEHSDIIVK